MPAAVVSFTMETKKDEYTPDRRDSDYRRQKLTDVVEDDENEGENSGMTDPHFQQRKARLYSDASVVLTENTDSFIIGMKVWVGGTKPGQIAYLGETQFAPGEWAGIVLDEPIGKNDGSVSGIRYFQCEPKKGVFSRLTRLTLTPLLDVGDTSSITSGPTNGRKSSIASMAESIRSSTRTPLGMNMSTTSIGHHQELKIGERVIVQSSQGSKPGTLRYLGPTEFASGEWAGVELDDPLGKNDGSVEGKRYFECQPKFGLFAPAGKVSKSPSKHKPGSCVVHKGTGLRRAGSRESITSTASITSAASTARRVRLGVNSLSATPKRTAPSALSTPLKPSLQDVLGEKEVYIEKLLKERELEQTENARISVKTRQEYEQYRSECESKIHNLLSLLSQMEKEKGALSSSLDDEKKKLEDVQFRFEEELISKGDLNIANKEHKNKIKELEEALQFEVKKNHKLIKDYQSLQVEHKDRSKRSTDSEQEVQILKRSLEKVSSDLNTKTQQQQDLNSSFLEKDAIIDRLRKDLDNANTLLKEKQIDAELQFTKSLQQAEMQLSAKNYDYEQSVEKIQQLESEMGSLRKELDNAKKTIKSNCKIVESQNEQRYKNEAETLRKIVDEVTKRIYETRRETALTLAEKEMSLRDLGIKLKYENAENVRLRNELNTTISELTKHHENGKERHKRQIEQKHFQISEIINRFSVTTDQLSTCQILTTQLETEICMKNDIIEKLRIEYSSYGSTIEEQKAYIAKLISELKSAEARSSDWESKYSLAQQTIAMLTSLKEQLESQISEILNSSKDINQQLAALMADLRNSRAESERMRIELSNKIEAALKAEQEIRFNFEKQSEQFAFEKSELQTKLQFAIEAKNSIQETCNRSVNESLKLHESLQLKITELNKIIENSKLEFTKELDAANERVSHFEFLIQQLNTEKEKITQDFNIKFEQLSEEIVQLKEIVREKSTLLIEAEGKLNEHLLESTKLSNRDKMAFEQRISELMIEINSYKQSIQEANIALEKANVEVNEYKTSQFQFEQRLQEKEQQILEITNDKSKCESMYMETKNILTQTESRITELTTQVTQITEEKERLGTVVQENTVQLQQLNVQITNLQTEYQNLQTVIHEKEQNVLILTNQMKEIEAQRESMNNVLMERENKIMALTSQIEEVQKERGTTSQIFQKQEKQLLDMKMELQRITNEKEQVNNYIVQKDTQIADLTHQLDVRTEDIKRITLEKQNEISVIQQQIQQIEEQKTQVINNLEQKEEQLIVLNNNLQQLQTEKVILEKNVKEHEQNFLVVKEELERTGDCKAASQAVAAELEHRVEEKQQTINILNAEVTKLREQWEKPTSNPIVHEIVIQLEDKEKQLEDRDQKIIVLNNEIKQAVLQTQQVQQQWEQTVEQWKEKALQLEEVKKASTQQCANVQQQVIVLTQQLQEAEKVEQELSVEREKYAQLYVQLTASEQQKTDLLKKLDVVVDQKQTQTEECQPVVKIIKEIQQMPTLEVDHFKQQLEYNNVEVHKELQEVKQELEVKLQELTTQKQECANLQQQLLKVETRVIEVPVPVPGPVQIVEKCTAAVQTNAEVNANFMHETPVSIPIPESLSLQKMTQNHITQSQPQIITKIVEKPIYIEKPYPVYVPSTTQQHELFVQKQQNRNFVASDYPVLHTEMVKPVVYQQSVPMVNSAATCTADMQQIMQEHSIAVGQVDFLNSIIVDMQRKNEELRARIEILETTSYAADARTQSEMHIGAKKVVPPRVYCDICEVFDAHETEDCPIQITDTEVDDVIKTLQPGVRPYCDICEAFGHTTADCNANEEY